MTDFNTKRTELGDARAQKKQKREEFFIAKEQLEKVKAEQALLNRVFDKENPKHGKWYKELEAMSKNLEGSIGLLGKEYQATRKFELGKMGEFSLFSDPTVQVNQLSADYPFLLMPVRLETRFKTVKQGGADKDQLWLRVFPDDCLVDSFEPYLSGTEMASARAYWAEIWRAGGDEELEKGAWRALVESHGTGRAAWIAKHKEYTPKNPGDKPGGGTDHIILVIPTDLPLSGPEKTKVHGFYEKIWLADGDAQKEKDAYDALAADLGEPRAKEIIAYYKPVNMDDAPVPPLTKADVTLTVAAVEFPAPGDVESTKDSWTRAAEVNIMPDRFVVIAHPKGGKPFNVTGKPIPSPLPVGPDPSAPEGDQLKPENGDITVNEDIKWLTDFDRAVDTGMGFKIDLTPQQASAGFDKILVLGVRLSSDENESRELLGTLFHNHFYGGTGFAFLPPGTPTNNTDDGGSGYQFSDDADAAYDDIFKEKAPGFFQQTDWFKKPDGQWFAEFLRLDAEGFKNIPNADQGNTGEAMAMNTALWPGTIGYFMETMMDPVFDQDTVSQARWFFNHFVSGRGMVPSIRIGDQPYGILPVTAFSRVAWTGDDSLWRVSGLWPPEGFHRFRVNLKDILERVADDWRNNLLPGVSYLGKPGLKDAHQLLLDILGLHAGSVEFYQRFAESLEHLLNRVKLTSRDGMKMQQMIREQLQAAMQLLSNCGYHGKTVPDILNKFFLEKPNQIDEKFIIDDRPLSETEPIRNYAAGDKNYMGWLIDGALTSLETIRKQENFIDNKPPAALLYQMLRYAIMQGYWDTGMRLYEEKGILAGDSLQLARKEPFFIHIQEEDNGVKSRWHYLYRPEPEITGHNTRLVAEYIPQVVKTAPAARYLRDQIDALKHLEHVPTARLERVFAEHTDCCSYRLDAWRTGLVNYQLAGMRSRKPEPGKTPASEGIYLGAYGWLEEVVPEHKKMEPVKLEPGSELDDKFNTPGSAPLMKDFSNAGFIHAPSLNHAVTAAVLRNAYLSNTSPENRESFAVNLSSRRVRLALSILEGIRNGQSLGALLGYRFERGLHDNYKIAETDQYIFYLRRAFPLYSQRFKLTKAPADTDIRDIEARNVLNGLDLIEHIKKTGKDTYPFGKHLPPAGQAHEDAINAEVKDLMDLNDAVADVIMAEGVHQVVQGNYDRAAATLDALSKASVPTEPDVVQTPRSGITLTHRVGLHLDPEADPAVSPFSSIPMTPRAEAEPAINQWLVSILPPPEKVVCTVSYEDTFTGGSGGRLASQEDLGLQPIDLLFLLQPESLMQKENQQAMTGMDDLITRFAVQDFNLGAGADITIDYMKGDDTDNTKITFFQMGPLIKRLRSLLLRSRPLKPGDMALGEDADSETDRAAFLGRDRIDPVTARLGTVKTALDTFYTNLSPLLADTETNGGTIIANIDNYTDQMEAQLAAAGSCGIPETGTGFILQWKRGLFGALANKIDELAARVGDKFVLFDKLIAQYDLSGGAAPEEKYELLQKAEVCISAAATIPPPPDPDNYKADLLTEKGNVEGRIDDFTALKSTKKKISGMIAGIKAQPDVSGFDLDGMDIEDEEKRVLRFAADLAELAQSLAGVIQKRLDGVADLMTGWENKAQPGEQARVIVEAAKILLGEDFNVVPSFQLSGEQGGELENSFNNKKNLLDHLVNTVKTPFPVDEWLYGIARVHEKMRDWENAVMLAGAFGVAEPGLHPVQLPHRADDSWLALEFPADYTFDGDRLLYTAHIPGGFDKNAKQCGLLLDEWTEVIPTPEETTGITFHYDRPNSEPPQAMLLVTPSAFTGGWQWEDLVAALNETLDNAKLRAIEPAHIDENNRYARFLPAAITAVTFYPITISMNFAMVNALAAQGNEDDG